MPLIMISRALPFSLIFILLFVSILPANQEAEQPKKIIAVYDLKGYQVAEVVTKALTDRLRDEIFHREIYRVVTRNDMDLVFEEQGLQKSGACDDASCLIEIGRVLGAEYIIGGSVSMIDDKYTVTVSTIDVESGEVMNSSSLSKMKTMDELIGSGIVKIVDKLLKKKGGIFRSPYFWSGVAVTAATGAYFILQDKESESTSTTPVEVIIEFP